MLNRFKGCMLGGAAGDALGFPVELMNRNKIVEIFGKLGITDFYIKSGDKKAKISDDTQMTLFTAEGLLWGTQSGAVHASYIFYSYQRWLFTQTGKLADEKYGWILQKDSDAYHSRLMKQRAMYEKRGPGQTCLSALESACGGRYGQINNKINDSKGCGGAMRAAPIGLYFWNDTEKAFRMGCESAAITHGHPSGYLSAGVLAAIISCILRGMDVKNATLSAMRILKNYDGSRECYSALNKAIFLAESDVLPLEAVSRIGLGKVGEEAVAIAIYCSLVHESSFKNAVCLAVNHDGDSDSTGAICGSIMGALLGINAIPRKWVKQLEFAPIISAVAGDLFNQAQH